MDLEIKICGLTRLDDALAALAEGADYLGFVLYPRSPRAVSADALAALRAALPGAARVVGVFVNEAPGTVARVAVQCGLAAVQIHGDEPLQGFDRLPLPVWRAVRGGDRGFEPEPGQWPAARYVVDAAAPGDYGGTGRLADWVAAAELAKRRPVMLAGGLTPANVEAALAAVRPQGVDVSSGIEAFPGVKDRGRLREFIRKARAAAARLP